MKASPLVSSGITLITVTLIIIFLLIGCQDTPQPQTSPTATTATTVPTQSSVLPTATATKPKRIPARRSGQQPYSPYLELSLQRASTGPTSLQMPAAVEATLTGREIINVSFLAGRYEPGGERRLVSSLMVRPGSFGEPKEDGWPDGSSELSYVWQTEGDYLSDGSSGEFVLLQESDPAEDYWVVAGQFRPSDSQKFESVELLIQRESGVVLGINSHQKNELLQARAGDELQILDFYLDNSGEIMNRPGQILKFDEAGQLSFRRMPLPAGDYFLAYLANSETGLKEILSVDYLVGNENLLPGKRAYFQPEFGFQFLYPEEWSGLNAPVGPTLMTNVAPTLTLQIAIDPALGEGRRDAGQRPILNVFGEVEVLYEDQFEMGLYGGLRTIYGYESSTGSRIGVLLTFSYDGRDFVLDVDGPEEAEQQIVSVAQSIIDSWIWRSLPDGTGNGRWYTIKIDDMQLAAPANYQYDVLNNGWQRLSDDQLNAFLAFRMNDRAESSSESRLSYWEMVASRDVTNYLRSDIYEQQLAGIAWHRIDFQYDSEDLGEIWGAIMASVSDSTEFVAWMEAPASDFMRIEEEQLSLILTNLVRQQ